MKPIRIAFLSLLLLLLQNVKLSAQWTVPNGAGNINNTNVNNVGINTTNPQYRLDVNGTIGLNNTLDQGPFNPNAPAPGPGLAPVNAIFGGLTIHSTAFDATVMNTFWGQNVDYHTNADIRYRIAGPAVLTQYVNGNMYFYTGARGAAGAQIPNFANTPKVSLANNGGFAIGTTYAIGNTTGQGILSVENNIGLGTQAPTSQFHSTGSVRFQGLLQNNFVTDVVMRDGNGNLSYRNLSTIIPTLQNAWVLNGNTPAAAEFLGTTNASDLRINTNGLQRMVVSSQGNVGINTTSPTAYFHVNCVGGNPDDGGVLSDVRFEGLETGTGSVLVIDKFGYVHNSRVGISSGISNNCTTINTIPKVADANGNLTCSQIYDDGSFVGVATTSPYFVNGTMSKLNVNGLTVSNSFYAISDGKYKQNVETISNASSIINRLRGVTYTWNKKGYADKNFEDGKQAGFIAQEVNSVYPLAVGVDEKDNYVVNYNAFIPLLTRGQQELYTMVNGLKDKNASLQKEIDNLQSQLNQVAKGNNVENVMVLNKNSSTDNKLYQNKPNPFSNSTTIEYDLVKMKNNAYIIVYDLSGKELSRTKISSQGHGSVQINSGELHSGMYLYSLIIDGEEADTKRMVLLKN